MTLMKDVNAPVGGVTAKASKATDFIVDEISRLLGNPELKKLRRPSIRNEEVVGYHMELARGSKESRQFQAVCDIFEPLRERYCPGLVVTSINFAFPNVSTKF